MDDPALAVVDGDLVGGDGSGGRRPGRLLQLRGARPRVPRWTAPARGRGAGDPLAPPQAPDASPAATRKRLPSSACASEAWHPVYQEPRMVIVWGKRRARWLS